MSKEKIENEKSLRRKREWSMVLYEIGRRVFSFIPRKKNVLHSGRKFRRRQTLFVWSILAIPILHFLVFWVYVNFDSILLAFRNIDHKAGGYEYWTLDNFKEVYRMFTEGGRGRNMVQYGSNTLKFWLLSVLWGIPHSILLTYVFHKKLAGRKIYRVLLYLPSIICAVSLAGIFEAFIGGNGVFGYMLTTVFGVERVPSWFQEQEWAVWGLLFYNFFFGFSGHYILYSGAMANIDTEITEAAYMDGVSMWQELLYIDIPLMWPTLSMTVITSFGGLFGASGPILLFTKSMESTFTFGYWIFDQVRVYQSYYLPATLGLCFTVVAFPIAMLVKRVVENMFTTE